MKKSKIINLVFVILSMQFSYKISYADANNQSSSVNMADSLSIKFQQISVREALQLLAEFAHYNIIVGDAVKGTLSLNLQNLSFLQIVEVIMKNQHLTQTLIDGVINIEPVSTTMDNLSNSQSNKQQTQIYHLSYAKAADVLKIIQNKPLLVAGSSQIVADERTNSLVIQDETSHFPILLSFVKELDRPVPQVFIQARIVNIDSNYEKELGVRFGLTSAIPTSLHVANDGVTNGQADPTQLLNVNLPAVAAEAGQFGVALFKVADGTLLDLELSALESEGHGQVISRPQLLTADRQSANIQAGEELPYQESTVSGATSVVFKKAVLSLQVTPQITPQQKILLILQVHQDSPGSQMVKGVPAIDTRQISTQVMADNGETVVLGGIYEDSQNNGIKQIPFLSSLPYVGNLFRYKRTSVKHRELLIFVTAKIVNDNIH